LGGTPFQPELLRREIRTLKERTKGPFGVNIVAPASVPERLAEVEVPERLPGPLVQAMEELRALGVEPGSVDLGRPVLVMETVRQQLEVILEEGASVLVLGLGTPRWAVERAHAAGLRVFSMVGSVRHAELAFAAGADGVIAQGTEAGGHTGRVSTFALVPQVVDVADGRPVLAAGGVGDGRGLAAALVLGAEGAVMGTRFLATRESAAHENFKAKIVASRAEDAVVTRAYTGKTARHLRNRYIELWEGHEDEILKAPLQRILVEPMAAAARVAGAMDYASSASGQVVGLIRDVPSAAEVLERVVREAEEVLDEGLWQRVRTAGHPGVRSAR
jgi:NAD(P)H-dependent flavin oxidoreductase YrpB (nitropropane dioxygenase family)